MSKMIHTPYDGAGEDPEHRAPRDSVSNAGACEMRSTPAARFRIIIVFIPDAPGTENK